MVSLEEEGQQDIPIHVQSFIEYERTWGGLPVVIYFPNGDMINTLEGPSYKVDSWCKIREFLEGGCPKRILDYGIGILSEIIFHDIFNYLFRNSNWYLVHAGAHLDRPPIGVRSMDLILCYRRKQGTYDAIAGIDLTLVNTFGRNGCPRNIRRKRKPGMNRYVGLPIMVLSLHDLLFNVENVGELSFARVLKNIIVPRIRSGLYNERDPLNAVPLVDIKDVMIQILFEIQRSIIYADIVIEEKDLRSGPLTYFFTQTM